MLKNISSVKIKFQGKNLWIKKFRFKKRIMRESLSSSHQVEIEFFEGDVIFLFLKSASRHMPRNLRTLFAGNVSGMNDMIF